jgi:hypothetical protein
MVANTLVYPLDMYVVCLFLLFHMFMWCANLSVKTRLQVQTDEPGIANPEE